MELKELIEHLKDMELLYGNAVIHVKSDQNEYRIKSVNGFMGEKRPNECRDPHVIVINIKNIKTIHPEKKVGKWVEIKNSKGTIIALRCSQCFQSPKQGIRSDFCPNCGSDNRGEQE